MLSEFLFDLGNDIIDWPSVSISGIVLGDSAFSLVKPKLIGIFISTGIKALDQPQSQSSPLARFRHLSLLFYVSGL